MASPLDFRRVFFLSGNRLAGVFSLDFVTCDPSPRLRNMYVRAFVTYCSAEVRYISAEVRYISADRSFQFSSVDSA